MKRTSILHELTVNEDFIRDFISEKTPCFSLGIIEEKGKEVGFMAIRPDVDIPLETLNQGFNFGHSLIGNQNNVLLHFAFLFYGFSRYDVLINPDNPLVKKVLSTMMDNGDYLFLSIAKDLSVTTFREQINQGDFVEIKSNFSKIQNSKTTNSKYLELVSTYRKNIEPGVILMDWVCYENIDYMDLTKNRILMNPRS